MNASSERSLKYQTAVRLLGPLLVLMLMGAFASYYVAVRFANRVYDGWLYDSARSLAGQIKWVHGSARVELPRVAIEMFEWDVADRTYYTVTGSSRGVIFGNVSLPMPSVLPADLNRPTYHDTSLQGRPVRVVAIRLPSNAGDEEVLVQVGETRTKRETLTREILATLIPPVGLLILAVATIVWFGVTSGLRPLTLIASEIAARNPHDLRPLSDAMPSEITPIKHSLNHLLQQLAAAYAAQQRFIANAAHQLRTPLSALQVQAERALRERNPQAHEEALKHVLAAGERLNRLSHQLLTLARTEPEAGAALHFVSVDLAGLAREVTAEWVSASLEQGVDLGYVGPDQAVHVKGDPLLLRELLENLIDNALRYGSHPGNVTVGIEGSAAPSLYVEDDGPGIPVEARQTVLERFSRLPGSSGQGCGLGLAIAREICALHDASIHIDQAAGEKGARFTVSFPAG